MKFQDVIEAVSTERASQIRKHHLTRWHDLEYDPDWFLVLAEEFGEIAKAMLENKTKRPSEEIIQTAAVLIAWAEDIDERGEFPSEEYGGFNDEAQKAAKEAKSS